jgi:dolichol-phosphate mannosyltransferase
VKQRTINGKKISVILPTFNEKENVIEVYRRIKDAIAQFNIAYEIIFVDDNSPDGTTNLVKELRKQDSNVKYILMSRRFGDQISLMAGINNASGDMVVTMDSDLQHPPEYLPQMIEQWRSGYDIVIMKREEAGHNSFFKKWSELLFYRLLGKLSKTPIYFRFAGYALMDRKAVDALKEFRERDPFLRGLRAYSNKTEMLYKEEERSAGTSKYKLMDMFKLAITGITSFSDTPLYLSFYTGFLAVSISLIYAIWVIIETVFFCSKVPGWASTILVVIFFGGVQLISIGILGIFISKVFVETKRRPNFIIAESSGFDID